MRTLLALSILSLILILAKDDAFCESIDADSLMSLAPRISLKEETISSFRVKGVFNFGGLKYRFSVSAKKPDQVSVRVMDPSDGTPIMVGASGSLFIYDSIKSEAVLAEAIPHFSLSFENESGSTIKPRLVAGFGFNGTTAKNKASDDLPSAYRTIVDIPSIVAKLTRPIRVQTDATDDFIISGSSTNGGILIAHISPSRKEGAYTRLEIYPPKSEIPFIVLDEIILNQPIPAKHFAFPKEKILASGVKISTISDQGLINSLLSTRQLMLGLMTRLALSSGDNSEMRATVEELSMRKLNWAELERKDQKLSAILRPIFQDDSLQPTKEDEKTNQQ